MLDHAAAHDRKLQTGFETPCIAQPWDIYQQNAAQIAADFPLATSLYKHTYNTDRHTAVYGADNLFIAEGAKIRAAVINAESGPIFIGPGADVQEGAMISGSHALCAHAVANMGAKLRGDSTLGPYCKVGGEVSNSVMFGYSNKGHDGFMGNSVLGEWCNLGADTNTSNLKNNYSAVRVWSYKEQQEVETGLQFCGLLMADHGKTGINTMLNTGTVAGVAANIFGAGFPPKHIPSFAWGGPEGFMEARLDKIAETADRMMQRRKLSLSEAQQKVLEKVFELTKGDREELS